MCRLVVVHTRKKHLVVVADDSLRFHPGVGRMSNSIANLGWWERHKHSDRFGSMTALVARTGRHQQRYEHGYRLVAGCGFSVLHPCLDFFFSDVSGKNKSCSEKQCVCTVVRGVTSKEHQSAFVH